MTNKEIVYKELEILVMDRVELERFSAVVHSSMLDSNTKRVLLNAVDSRSEKIAGLDVNDALAVESEIEED